MHRAWSLSTRRILAFAVLVAVVTTIALAVNRWSPKPVGAERASTKLDETSVTPASTDPSPAEPQIVDLPRDTWEAAGLKMEPVQVASLAQSIELTGKVALNEDRVAHIFPLVDGRVDEVKIKLGDKVKRGDLLVVVQSIEVGRTMLQLFQDRLQRDFAITKDRWTQTVTTNTQAMIALIRSGATIEEIEKQLTDRPMGEYRDKLMTAYVSFYKARKTLERLKPLTEQGSITGKQLLEAESDLNGTRATLQSLLEQFHQETQQSSAMSAQAVKELETRVAVDETNLKILGFDDESLVAIDPVKQGETVSHYPIHSPFDGTIISKDVVLLERVGPESQILSIADLSSVWVTTDVYEENLRLLKQLDNRSIIFRSPAWPGETFEARIFYTGDLVHESSRTVAMRAIADNADGRLRPGMFVTVEFPSIERQDVMQVPVTAVQEHAGKSFVFVHLKNEQFERRDVTLGIRNSDHVEVLTGLKANEVVVTRGGFALKTRMLAELLSE